MLTPVICLYLLHINVDQVISVFQYEEAEWVGLSIKQALDRADWLQAKSRVVPPLKHMLADACREGYKGTFCCLLTLDCFQHWLCHMLLVGLST